jgi:adenylate cyclase
LEFSITMFPVTHWLGKGFQTDVRARFATSIASTMAVGVLSAILVLVPQIRDLEQSVGLGWLFKWRGPLPPPEGIVLVTISGEAAEKMFLPRDPQKFHRCDDLRMGVLPASHAALPSLPARWPRCLHTLLIDRLAKAGARVIAFDVLFRTRPALPGSGGDLNALQDRQLAGALARSRNVLIGGKLKPSEARPADGVQSIREELVEISSPILDAALGHAPFPVIERGGRLDEYMVFTQGGSTTPSLPALSVQAYFLDVYPQFRNMLERFVPEYAQLLPSSIEDLRRLGQLQVVSRVIRQTFADSPLLGVQMQSALASKQWAHLDVEVRAHIGSLVTMYSGPDTHLLNFIGPPGTLHTYGYDQILAFDEKQLRAAFHDKMVFVGYAETLSPEQVEHFATVYTVPQGVALSGIEIAATAFDNLLNDSAIRPAPLWVWMLICLLAGIASTVLCVSLDTRLAIPLAGVALAGYAGGTLGYFAGTEVWLPLVIPLGIASPLGIATGLLWKYRVARRQRETLRDAFMKFVPRQVVDELESNAGRFGLSRESVECACVATDVANFTTLAEAMSSEELADFLNRYFEQLFRPVARHGGFVSDIVGDAMLAIWPQRSADMREHMLSALLEMSEAARLFDELPVPGRMKTRFGVDWGHVTLTLIGSPTHYEYRAVGDAVTTATRIQELNKKLGTRVLVSMPALGKASQAFLVRDLGLFLLRGKTLPVHVAELMGRRENATEAELLLCRLFRSGIDLLRDNKSADALSVFCKTLQEFPDDRATAFFVERLESGNAWVQGAIRVE